MGWREAEIVPMDGYLQHGNYVLNKTIVLTGSDDIPLPVRLCQAVISDIVSLGRYCKPITISVISLCFNFIGILAALIVLLRKNLAILLLFTLKIMWFNRKRRVSVFLLLSRSLQSRGFQPRPVMSSATLLLACISLNFQGCFWVWCLHIYIM